MSRIFEDCDRPENRRDVYYCMYYLCGLVMEYRVLVLKGIFSRFIFFATENCLCLLIHALLIAYQFSGSKYLRQRLNILTKLVLVRRQKRHEAMFGSPTRGARGVGR